MQIVFTLILLSLSLISGNSYATKWVNPFENRCAKHECNSCQASAFAFETKIVQKQYDIDFANNIQTLKSLLLARKFIIEDVAEKAQIEIDSIIYNTLLTVLYRQYGFALYEEFISPDLTEISMMKIEFFTHPLMISDEEQAKLDEQYEKNKI